MRAPFYIEMSGKKILIIGGGQEGSRRAEKYLEKGAEITVYSRSFEGRLLELSKNGLIRLVVGDVEDERNLEKYIEDADIVMVALEKSDYNEVIARIAKKHRKLLNLANDAEGTEVVVPIDSTVGPFRIAVTTEGMSSMVAREALKRITKFLEGERDLKIMAELMYLTKKIVKRKVPDYGRRMEIYSEVFNDPGLREASAAGDFETARRILDKILERWGLRIERCEST